MKEVFIATLSPMLMMFSCIVIGFILNKRRLTPDNTVTVLSKLENYVIVPALVINTFMRYCTIESLKKEYKFILFSIIILIIAISIGILLSGVFSKDEYEKNIYKYAMSFANFGFMGNAIVPAILGEEMLYHYLLFTLPLNIAVYTWGLVLLIPKGQHETSTLKRLLNPIFVAMVIGIFLGITGIEKYLPSFFGTTVSNLGACMGPLAMILTGFVVANYDIKKLLRNSKVYIATALRLIVLPTIFLAIGYFLGADKTTMSLTLFAYATPLGLNTIVFPAAYGGNTETGASMATISHTLCVITIPILYSILLQII